METIYEKYMALPIDKGLLCLEYDTCSFDWQHIVASYGVGASSHEWSVD